MSSVNRIAQLNMEAKRAQACASCGGLGVVVLRGETSVAQGALPTLPCPDCRLAYDHDGSLFIRPNSILLD